MFSRFFRWLSGPAPPVPPDPLSAYIAALLDERNYLRAKLAEMETRLLSMLDARALTLAESVERRKHTSLQQPAPPSPFSPHNVMPLPAQIDGTNIHDIPSLGPEHSFRIARGADGMPYIIENPYDWRSGEERPSKTREQIEEEFRTPAPGTPSPAKKEN